MNKRVLSAALVIAITMSAFTGCASPGKRTAIGAGAGALGGAAVGALLGGKKGALIGGAVGAAAGAGVGNYLDKQAEELAQVAETKRTADGILVNLKSDLLFASGSASLKPAAVDQISKLGDILVKYPENKLRIEGHTDNVGSVATNEELSKRRAESVREVLTSRGVQPAQMLVLGAGKSRPITDNKSADGRAKNRRVELFITVEQT